MIVKWVCKKCGIQTSGCTVTADELVLERPPVCARCSGTLQAEYDHEKTDWIPSIPNPPPTPTHNLPGVKHDASKPRWDLLPIRETEEVVHVLTAGSVKYSDDNWKIVDNSRNRYFAALMRHVMAWWTGETFDPETKRHHLAHAVCCCLFLMWFDLEKMK